MKNPHSTRKDSVVVPAWMKDIEAYVPLKRQSLITIEMGNLIRVARSKKPKPVAWPAIASLIEKHFGLVLCPNAFQRYWREDRTGGESCANTEKETAISRK